MEEQQRRRRKRYNAAEQAMVISLYEQSGMTLGVFCEREGIDRKRVGRWMARQAERREGKSPNAGSTTRFVEVEPEREPRLERRSEGYRIGFEGGAWLEVGCGFDESEVRVLAGIVREMSQC